MNKMNLKSSFDVLIDNNEYFLIYNIGLHVWIDPYFNYMYFIDLSIFISSLIRYFIFYLDINQVYLFETIPHLDI